MSPSTPQFPSVVLDHRQHPKSLEVVLSSEDETTLLTLLLPVVGHSLASNCRVTCGGKRGRCGLLWRTRDPVVVASSSFMQIVASRISSGFYQAPYHAPALVVAISSTLHHPRMHLVVLPLRF